MPIKCAECGLPYFLWGSEWIPNEYCRNGHPPRAPKVHIHKTPKWLRGVLNMAYPEEVAQFVRTGLYGNRNRTKLGSRHESANFLANHVHRMIGCSPFDHWGTDDEGNLVTEPYAKECDLCIAGVKEFAEKTGLRLTISDVTWHAPWIKECIRITFALPSL